MSDTSDTNDEAIRKQQELLTRHRERLAILLKQQTHFGAYVPPHILTSIREAQQALRSIKAWLRSQGAAVTNEPNDEVQVTIDPTPAHQPGQSVNQTINNPASNQDAQGNFYAPVLFHQAMPTPAAPAPAFQVPYPQSALFVGRDAELERLAALLNSNEAIAVVPAIAGTGGIGKTMLAAEFAHRYRKRFGGGVFWLNMEDPEDIASQVAACAGPGGLQLAGYDAWSFEDRIAAVRNAWQQPDRCLLIFDNLEDPTLLRWRPTSGGCSVLITTRRATWAAHSGVRALLLDTLARPDSLRLLLTPRYGSTLPDDPAADAICEVLEDLPLAITLAGTYLEHYPDVPLDDYKTKIISNPVNHESLNAVLEEGLPTAHASSIVATFALSYNRLQTDDPIDTLARTLLHRAAYYAPIAIPRALLAYTDAAAQEATEYQRNVDAALHRLLALGLLDDLGSAGVRLHRLLAAFARSRTPNPDLEQQWVIRTLTVLLYKIIKMGYPQAGLPYLEHVRNIANATTDDITHADLLNNLGRLLRIQGDLTDARFYFQRALDINEQALGSDHLDTAQSLNNLGSLLQDMGDLTNARPYFQRALDIHEHVLGLDHPDTATSLNNLGTLLQAMGNLEGARPYFQRALDIRERVLGLEHPDTTTSLNNLGILLDRLGDLEGARSYYQRALDIRERVLGLEHPDTTTSLNNLGTLLQAMGNLEGAHPYFQRALDINERVLGPDHPITVSSLNNLGALLRAQSDLEGAHPYYQRALDINERVLGPDHPITASSLNNLAYLLQDMGDLEGARLYFQRALDIRERALGANHLDTARSLNNLACLLQKMGDLATAHPYYKRALEIRERVLGANHPYTAQSLNNLGYLLQEMGDLAGARVYLEQALRIQEQVLGPTHPNTVANLHGLSNLALAMQDYAGAHPLYKRLLNMSKRVDNVYMQTTALIGLANLHFNLRDYDQAITSAEQALAIYETLGNATKPAVAKAIEALGLAYQDRGDLSIALPLLKRVTTIYQQTSPEDNIDTIQALNNLAMILWEMQSPQAIIHLDLVNKLLSTNIQQIDSYTDTIVATIENIITDISSVLSSAPEQGAALNRVIEYLDTLAAEIERFSPVRKLLRPILQRWRVVASRVAGQIGRLPTLKPLTNPYIFTVPVQGDQLVGRDDLFQQIEALWNRPGQRNSLLIHGHRRMGKTSLALALQSRCRFDYDTRLCYLTLDGIDLSQESFLFLEIAYQFHQLCEEHLEEPRDEDFLGVSARTTFNSYIRRIDKVISPLRVILVLDEFERIDRYLGHTTFVEIIDFLRAKTQTYHWLTLALVGLTDLDDLSRSYRTSVLGWQGIRVSFLTPPQVHQVLTKPPHAPDVFLDYKKEAIQLIAELTHGQPYLIQVIGGRLIDYYNQRLQEDQHNFTTCLDRDDVETVISDPAFYDNADAYFHGVWSQFETGQQLLIAIAATKNGIDEQTLRTIVGNQSSNFDEALNALLRHEIVHHIDQKICLTVPLMQNWLLKHADQQQSSIR